jgi:hypothetical protein
MKFLEKIEVYQKVREEQAIEQVIERLERGPEYLPSGPPLAEDSPHSVWKAGEKRCPHDGGKCHHVCSDEEPCFRERGGMRLTKPYRGYPRPGHKLEPLD